MKIFLILFALSSCFQKEGPVENNKYNELQAKAVAGLPLYQQAYMEECYLNNNYATFNTCLYTALKLGSNCEGTKKTSVGEIAVGSAIGVGATKLLLGK